MFSVKQGFKRHTDRGTNTTSGEPIAQRSQFVRKEIRFHLSSFTPSSVVVPFKNIRVPCPPPCTSPISNNLFDRPVLGFLNSCQLTNCNAHLPFSSVVTSLGWRTIPCSSFLVPRQQGRGQRRCSARKSDVLETQDSISRSVGVYRLREFLCFYLRKWRTA